jgi:hypothetical protein
MIFLNLKLNLIIYHQILFRKHPLFDASISGMYAVMKNQTPPCEDFTFSLDAYGYKQHDVKTIKIGDRRRKKDS